MKKGFTLIEMIIYTAILSLIFVFVINTLLIISRSYRTIKLINDINNSASLSFERLVREIRLAESVNVPQSTLETSPGILVLNTTDKLGEPIVLKFYIDQNALKLDEGGILSGALTRDNIVVSNLIFDHIISSTSEAVKIWMELSSDNEGVNKVESFYTTAVLRSSY